MTVQPIRTQPIPTLDELTKHPDRRIAAQAVKASSARKRLLELLDAYGQTAELRAERDELKHRLAQVEAELRGAKTVAKPGVDWPAVRAWAKAEGIVCPATGKVPGHVVDAYRAAHGGAK